MSKIYKLGDLAEIGRGSSPRPITDQRYFINGDIPWIKIADATSTGKYIYETREHVNEYGASFSRKLKPNTLIIAASGTLGFPKFLGCEGCIHDGWMYFSDIKADLIEPNYLYYSLITLRNYYNNLSYGAAIQNINTPIVKKTKIELPTLDEHEKIADILSTYDNLIENNNRRIALLEKTAQELYKEWFVRFRFPGYETAEFENGYPAKWKVEKVKSIVKRLPFGRLYKEADVSKEGNVIVIDQSKEACVGFHNDDPSHIATIDRPIILFGDHSCKFELMITPFSLSENVVPFVGTENVDSAYLYFLVKDLIETTEYKRHWTELMSKKVLLADNDIQKEFTKVIKSNLLLIESLKVQNRNLTKQRDLLLPRLMSGKLEVG